MSLNPGPAYGWRVSVNRSTKCLNILKCILNISASIVCICFNLCKVRNKEQTLHCAVSNSFNSHGPNSIGCVPRIVVFPPLKNDFVRWWWLIDGDGSDNVMMNWWKRIVPMWMNVDEESKCTRLNAIRSKITWNQTYRARVCLQEIKHARGKDVLRSLVAF